MYKVMFERLWWYNFYTTAMAETKKELGIMILDFLVVRRMKKASKQAKACRLWLNGLCFSVIPKTIP